jgi:prepilin-type processing-associated H-X9-DG protein
VFAYNRATRLQDITDGTSNTIAISDGSDPGPWGAGGHATIRALTEKPYINGPDGIGGPHAGGVSVGLCDGSVRFVSENIDPSVLEALVTIRGGESVGSF